MSVKKNIFLIICALFVLVSANGYAVADKSTLFIATEESQSISEADNTPISDARISTIHGNWGFLVKGEESSHSGFHNLQNDKKNIHGTLASQSIFCSHAFYASYSLNRINSITNFPFYIIYHRLTI